MKLTIPKRGEGRYIVKTWGHGVCVVIGCNDKMAKEE